MVKTPVAKSGARSKSKAGARKPPQHRSDEGKRAHDALIQRASLRSANKKTYHIRDISTVPEFGNFHPIDFGAINWERRLACKADPLLFLSTYLPNVFYMGWADFHVDLVHGIEECIRNGGKKAFGLPRGSGKTAVTRGMILRATAYGMRSFAFFVGSREDKAQQTLDFIKGFWFRSTALQQDFPEIAYPVYRLEGKSGPAAHGQLYKDQRTHVTWSSKEIQYASMMLEEEDVATYLEHDPDSVLYLPDIGQEIDRYILNSAGCLIRVAGIDGSIRGEADLHPVRLTQPRPDFVLLDDVQKEQKADSPKSCENLERLIESAIDYLAAPDVTQACLMPCTVIREGDVSDIYLDPMQKPEWNGVRHGVIAEYPAGMDDEVIMDEIDGKKNTQGRLWLQYKEKREQSYRRHGTLKDANAFYRRHRKTMDRGIKVTWNDRYKKDSPDPDKNEMSAIQSAMNWRFKDYLSFLSEAQNRPKSRQNVQSILLTPAQVAEHITRIPHSEVSIQWTNVVTFIDVQGEILFYTILAHDMDFNGQFIEYGTFPKLRSNYFKKGQLRGWKMLSRLYHKSHTSESGAKDAPFNAKLYHALGECMEWLFDREFPVHGDNQASPLKIRAVGIDTRWGESSGIIKRFIRERNDLRIISYLGQAFPPSNRQLEEYTMTAGWQFEHQRHPSCRESSWVIKPFQNGGRYVLSDVNRQKSRLMKHLATPLGSQGCITLYRATPSEHRMFAEHIAGSEYPEPQESRGIIKDMWHSRPGRETDNDYLDCAAGCICLASMCGASVKTPVTGKAAREKRKTLRQIWEQKQQQQKRS